METETDRLAQARALLAMVTNHQARLILGESGANLMVAHRLRV